VPADDPRLVILVLIDEPSTSSYGGVVAAPVFGAIATAALKQLGIQPPPPAPGVETASMRPGPWLQPALATVPPGGKSAAVLTGTPSFLGLSLREALTQAQSGGWEVRVTGSGWVAVQDPLPGAPFGTDRRLALQLRAERATARP
jgi:cell division protein FtsI (penicillin-binding protein 3)